MTLAILIIVLLSVLAVPLSLKKLIDQTKKTGREDVLPGFDMSEEGEHRMILESRSGYGIEVDEAIPEGAGRIIIAIHGFCGSKESKAITLLQRIETGKGNGLVRFDWPAHGRSRAEDREFTVENCLDDLNIVVEHVKRKYPKAQLIAFGSSFGGYITMLYNGKEPDTFNRIILRSPALRFGWILRESAKDEDIRKQLDEKGYFTTGYDRMLNVYEELIDEAEKYSVEEMYEDPRAWDLSRVHIVHGDADELVPYEDSVSFAEKHGIELYTVEGADHRYTGEGMLEEAVAFAARVIDRKDQGQV